MNSSAQTRRCVQHMEKESQFARQAKFLGTWMAEQRFAQRIDEIKNLQSIERLILVRTLRQQHYKFTCSIELQYAFGSVASRPANPVWLCWSKSNSWAPSFVYLTSTRRYRFGISFVGISIPFELDTGTEFRLLEVLSKLYGTWFRRVVFGFGA